MNAGLAHILRKATAFTIFSSVLSLKAKTIVVFSIYARLKLHAD